MFRSLAIAFLLLVGSSTSFAADADIDAILKGENQRAAWDRLVGRGPKILPSLLEAMDSKDTAAANWFRTAFDQIVDRELAAGGKAIDAELLLNYVKDAKHAGRSRRMALDVVDRLKPGTRDVMVSGWLSDPEFSFDAIAEIVIKAEKLPADDAKKELQKAFAASRDIEQSKAVAAKLDKLGAPVSVLKHLGFVNDWHVIGPFDGKGGKSFTTAYPPEEKVDLTAELAGKTGMIKWIKLAGKETNAGRIGLMNLLPSLGTHHDAAAYAFTTIHVEEAIEAEFRGAADDHFSAWVNGKRVFGFEEYRNGVRHDRHRFKVKLNAGNNTILLKIGQAPFDASSPEANWEFLLRVVDVEGKGLAFTVK